MKNIKISQNLSKSLKISQNLSKSLKISQNLSKSLKILVFSFSSITAHAAFPTFTSIVGFSFGGSQVSAGSAQVISFVPDEFGQSQLNLYTVANHHTTRLTANIHGGGMYTMPKHGLTLTAELLGFMQAPATISGQVLEQGLPDFNNFTYSYKVKSKGLMVESRLIYDKQHIKPYLLGGIGTAWNRSCDYLQRTANDFALSLLPLYPSHTQSQFAYELGAGLGVVKSQLFISLEYKYQNLGKTELGVIGPQLSSSPLISTLHSNQLLLNVTYLI